MAIGRTEDRVNPWDPVAQLEVTMSVWVPIRGFHLGQQSTRLHQQAGHMTASDQIDTTAAHTPCKSGAVHTWTPAQVAGMTIQFGMTTDISTAPAGSRCPPRRSW
jgi:hypothetical protein